MNGENAMQNIKELIEAQKENLGIHEYAFLRSDEIVFCDAVRQACAQNACGMYGTSWACPPAVGTVEQCQKECREYEYALVFTTMTVLQDRYDVGEWHEAARKHEAVTDRVSVIAAASCKTLTLSTEGCRICKTCTYPDRPCLFPGRMHPAVEGYGILVTDLAQSTGIRYINGPDSVTFFSLIFFCAGDVIPHPLGRA